MNTLDYLAEKYHLNVTGKHTVVEIPGTNRETLTHIFQELGFKVGVEMGVEAGIYSELICKHNPGVKLFCVDAWTAYQGYRDHVSQKKLDSIMEIARQRLLPYDAQLIKGFSMDVVKDIPDESLDFVYIDGNHEFQQTVNDIAEWSKKVRVGGIVAGHDYIRRKTNGYLMHVPMAIHGYIESYQIKPLFILGKREDQKPPQGIRDTARSWFFVKQAPPVIVKGSGHKIQT